MMRITTPKSGRGKHLRRLAAPLALAAAGIIASTSGSQAEVCELLQLTKVELRPMAAAPSEYAKLTGPNEFTIAVKQSWPWSPALMEFIRFTFSPMANVNPAWIPVIQKAGGAAFIDNQYASPFEGPKGKSVTTRTDWFPTPDPKSTGWPNDYPNEVYFKTGPVELGSCTEIRSRVAILKLDPSDLYRYQGNVPVAGCLDCPRMPVVRLPDIATNPVIIEPVKGKAVVQP
jgi:hypothetical protein